MKKLASLFFVFTLAFTLLFSVNVQARTVTNTLKIGESGTYGPTMGPGYYDAKYVVQSGSSHIKLKRITNDEGKFIKVTGKSKGTAKIVCSYGFNKKTGKCKSNTYVFKIKK